MVKKRLVRIIGFGFIVFGILWAIFDRFLWNSLCSVCDFQQLSPCFFLFLFVGIIFIISGVSLVLTPGFKSNNYHKNK